VPSEIPFHHIVWSPKMSSRELIGKNPSYARERKVFLGEGIRGVPRKKTGSVAPKFHGRCIIYSEARFIVFS